VIVSVEGAPEMTDLRRGPGVHEKAVSTLGRLKKIGIPTGFSTTITKTNYRYWMSPTHLEEYVSNGALVGIFIEYIPVGDDDDRSLMLSPEERQELRSRILEYRDNEPIYVVHSPGDEDEFGGCVSAGRGFAHITPHGDLTACPVSNLATHNMTSSTLREGLSSRLFEEIRANEHLLENDDSPCALFSHPEEVGEIAETVRAYRTDTYRL
jgi:MoaA/NifB/PqqE/SkfB family radical SAM enzyme